MFKTKLAALILLLVLTTSCASSTTVPVTESPTTPSISSTPTTTPLLTTMQTASITPTAKPSVSQKPASFVLGDLTISPAAITSGEKVTYSIPVSNSGGTEGSYTVVFNYKSSGESLGSEKVEVMLEPGQTKTATLTKTQNESGTYYINVNGKNSQYIVTTPIYTVPATSACAITSPPSSMEGINTHTEYDGTGADPNIITLGPKLASKPWTTYEHKPGMSFEAYTRGSPVLAPFDMVLVGFRDTSQNVAGGLADDVKLFFKSVSPDWPGMYMTVYHLVNSPLLTGHTISTSNDPSAPPAQGFQLFWNGNYELASSGGASAYGALIGYKVKRGELIGFAGTVPTADGVGKHSFADFYFDVPDTSVNPNIQNGDNHLHLVQPGTFFYWKSYSPSATFPSGVLAYPFECDGYQLPAEQRDVNFKYTAK